MNAKSSSISANKLAHSSSTYQLLMSGWWSGRLSTRKRRLSKCFEWTFVPQTLQLGGEICSQKRVI